MVKQLLKQPDSARTRVDAPLAARAAEEHANNAGQRRDAAEPRSVSGEVCLDDNLIVDLLEGRLNRDMALVEAHIDRCSACRELIADLVDKTVTPSSAPDTKREPSTMVVVAGQEISVAKEPLGWLAELELSDSHFGVGQVIDHFEIVRELGKGGMGEVYLARDTKLGRRVALKVVSRRHLEDGGDARRALDRFMREARTTARVSHANIVTIHAVGEHDGRPYLALEYVKGKTLRKYLRDHPKRTLRESLHIAVSIADALVAAHGLGVLHRDLKPDNVLISHDGSVRVVDFGLAETFEHEMTDTTRRDAADLGPIVTGIVGTPKYMAPEQWEDEERSGATDVWALGLIVFELLAGKHPFRSEKSMMDLAAAICSDDPVSPLPIAQDTATEVALKQLTERMLQKDAKSRPDAVEVARTLRHHHDELGVVITHAPSPHTAMLWGGFAVAAIVAGAAIALAWFGQSKPVVASPTRKAPSLLAASADDAEPVDAAPTSTAAPSAAASQAPDPRPRIVQPPRRAATPPRPLEKPQAPAPPPPPPPKAVPKDPLDVF